MLMKEYRIKITGKYDVIVLSPNMIARLIDKIRGSDTKEIVIPAEEILPQGYTEYIKRVMQTNSIQPHIGRKNVYDLTAKQIRLLKIDEERCFDKVDVDMPDDTANFNLETNEKFFMLTKQSSSRFICSYENENEIAVTLRYL